MNWKYMLLVAAVVILAVIIVPRFPSKADTQNNEVTANKVGTITYFSNGMTKIEPTAFAVSGPIRDLPATVPDAEAKSKAYITKQMKAQARRQMLIEKGWTLKQIDEDEINRENAKVLKKVKPGAGLGERPFVDPLLGANKGPNAPNAMPAPGLTFDGATQNDNTAQGVGAVLPPDVNGDVGLNHYVSSVNLVFKIFNKTGTVAAGPFKTSDLWSSLPANDPCRTENDGDPIVVYDNLADRWHISQFALPSPNKYQCVAVSTSGDPTGSYYIWSYVYPGQIFNDYPKVGVWPDAYHMTFNQFNAAGTAFLGMGILSQDRPKALAGDPAATVVYTNIAAIDPNAGGGLPADIDGIVPPPAGMAEVIAEYRADDFGDPLDAIRFYRWVPNFINPGASSISVLPDVALAPFDARNPSGRGDIEQSGGAALDSISDRLMHRFAYRNLGTQTSAVNSFSGSFTVNVSGVNPTTAATYQTGVRWFEMRRTGDAFTVFDQGTHHLTPGNGASGVNNWMSSIAQDNDGNIALGFSQAGTGQRADIKIAGRTGGQVAAGTLNEGETTFFAAGGSQTSTSNRWGDYSSMSVDPVDDCTFWYTQEYYASTGGASWSTRVGRFVYPSCTAAQKGTISGTVTFCSSGLPASGVLVSATGGYARMTGASGTYSMTVTPGNFNLFGTRDGGTTTGGAGPFNIVNGGNQTVDFCVTGVPLLAAGTATLVSESCLPANGVIDPGETVTVSFGVLNNGAANTDDDIGTLQAAGGVVSPGPSQNYGTINAGGSASKNFTFTASPSLNCGQAIQATIAHQDNSGNLGNLVYNLPTGALGPPSTSTYSSGNISVAITDNATVEVPIAVADTGAVQDINVKVRLNHTFDGDLVLSLVSPTGATVPLATNRGSSGDNFGSGSNDCAGTKTVFDDSAATAISAGAAPFAGSFRPESPLSAINGAATAGTWKLRVADTAGGDVGVIGCVDLEITRAAYVCATCGGGPTPTPTATPTGTPNIDVSPLSLTATQAANASTNQTLNIGNTGGGTLTWSIAEDPAAPIGSATDKPVSDDGVLKIAGNQGICTPTLTITEVFPGSLSAFDSITASTLAVTVDAVNIGIGLQGLTVISANNAIVTIPAFTPGTSNPVTATFTIPNGSLAADFTLRASSRTRALLITAECAAPPPPTPTPTPTATPTPTPTPTATPTPTPTPPPGPACDAPANVPWLSVSPASGSTAGGSSTPVTVTFNSTGLTPGQYNANLCVTSNDTTPGPGNGTALVPVPVTLNVSAPTPTPTPTPTATPTPTPTPTPGTCTPTLTVTEVTPGSMSAFTSITAGSGSVTVDPADVGIGLQSFTLVSSANAAVTIASFPPGTFNPVTAAFTRPNAGQPVDFTLRAASRINAVLIRAQCSAPAAAESGGAFSRLAPGVSFWLPGQAASGADTLFAIWNSVATDSKQPEENARN